MADMLIPYMALAEGKSTILTRDLSDHLETNIWLSEKMLKPKFCVHQINGLYRIEKGD
jgi:RNA 3'-terminal phosphate cyclase (ATP)